MTNAQCIHANNATQDGKDIYFFPVVDMFGYLTQYTINNRMEKFYGRCMTVDMFMEWQNINWK